MNNKNKILGWAVVLLVILNLTTLATLLYNRYQAQKNEDAVTITSEGTPVNGSFFRNEMGFDNTQMNMFRQTNQQFRPATMQLTAGIDSLKDSMFAELQKENPDTTKLNRLSRQIGLLHGELKYDTYRFYLSLRSICQQNQWGRLEKAFQPLFKNNDLNNGRFRKGKGGRYGMKNNSDNLN